MVRASTVIVAALAIAPVLAAPLTESEFTQDVAARSFDETPAELEARFKLGKVLKKFKGIAKIAANVVAPGAGAFIPREFEEDISELNAREPEPVNTAVTTGRTAAARTPAHPHTHAPGTHAHASHTKAGAHPVHKGVARHGAKGGPKHGRGTKGQKGAHSHKHSARGGKGAKAHNLKGAHKLGAHKSSRQGPKGHKSVTTQGNIPTNPGPRPARINTPRPQPREEEVELDSLVSRDALDLEATLADLVERGYLEIEEDVETREPKFRLGKFLGKVKNIAGKVTSVASKVVSTGAALGLREEDVEGLEFEARDFELEEVEERDVTEDESLDARFDLEESALDQLD